MTDETVKTELEQDVPMTCGGDPKPANPKGKIGEWNCVSGTWVWSEFIGD